ncbi:hypothetical protein WG66_000343 [Moniliophthora roreri]|nr:hypothetical protein WG66_000343 [Moniliophthora roreri]
MNLKSAAQGLGIGAGWTIVGRLACIAIDDGSEEKRRENQIIKLSSTQYPITRAYEDTAQAKASA